MNPLSPSQIANASAIYDFETPLEAAVAAWFTANDITAATTSTAPQFQNTRPRVEIEARQMNATKKAFGMPNDAAGPALNATYKMGLMVDVVTATDTDAKQAHNAFRAIVRLLLNFLPTIALDNHTIQGPISDNGVIQTIKSNEGYQMSRMSFEFDFSVKPKSWQQLAA